MTAAAELERAARQVVDDLSRRARVLRATGHDGLAEQLELTARDLRRALDALEQARKSEEP